LITENGVRMRIIDLRKIEEKTGSGIEARLGAKK